MKRGMTVFLFDLVLALLAWIVAYWLRFNMDVPPEFVGSMLTTLLVVMPVQGAVFYVFGLYRGLWRFASVSDLKLLLLAGGTVALATPAALLMLQQPMVPRSVFVLDPLLLVLMMGGARFAYRAWKDGHFYLRRTGVGTPLAIVGTGETAMRLVRELERNQEWQVIAVIDPLILDTAQRKLNGIPVFGVVAFDDFAQRFPGAHAVIAMPSESVAQRRRATELATAAGLTVMTVPPLEDLLAGRVSVSSIRKVELEDLLGRDRIDLDKAGLSRLLSNKTVLVTGAGGSIGAELCRQLLRFSPSRLVVVEQSEFALYQIGEELHLPTEVCEVADVKDVHRIKTVFVAHRPAVVFHAAAYKHVPLMEGGNAWAAVRNNVLGTLTAARAAMAAGTGEFVLISTDKAVNPTNVMGVTKRLAELVCQALQMNSTGTRFVMVRFGNVLGSSGSVIPKFREQIARGGPVTVTHPDIIRYFMLIPEAAQLVLQAGLMGQGGEVFVLDMGDPVKIVDLARDMIRLSGFSENDIQIEFTGLRPGEKLYEELLADGEATLPTPHPKLRIAKSTTVPDAAWLTELEAWLAVPWRDENEVKEGLRRWVPEYRPTVH
jgi:FlaA1/EpsC-like NDP-sugar epimerase